ncbi:DUF5707 domain-containing protein [Streptomyces ochraceiscleroticus]|uniref:DUF5707 domain-containing protein n=1 Tax=Streptomyces ochraceiscleroticus TaxID=47761 RepID=A0ABW1MIX2_9ACTN|nr:DUF5707 domain-containing protein [Streptomyces ochraceiscleroticus]
MHRRATAAAVSGALALTALAIPVAQADAGRTGDATVAARTAQESAVQQAASAKQKAAPAGLRAAADDGYGDTTISNVVVNGGKDVVLGTTNTKTVTVTFTATDASGIDWADAILWHGGATFDDMDTGVVANEEEADCTATSDTASKCTLTYTVDPLYLSNTDAGTWKVWALAQGNDADYVQQDNVKSFSVKRYSKLTTNASPEPVLKGRTLTITGSLTRANWDTSKYAGYTQQSVKLQSRPASGGTYATLKTYTSGSGSTAGQVKTTRTASTDTCWRYSFAGTSTTPAVTSTGDCVDVR